MLLTLNILVGANERVVKHHCLPFSAFKMNKRTFADNEVLIEVGLLSTHQESKPTEMGTYQYAMQLLKTDVIA